jgi:hypothetical protein
MKNGICGLIDENRKSKVKKRKEERNTWLLLNHLGQVSINSGPEIQVVDQPDK